MSEEALKYVLTFLVVVFLLCLQVFMKAQDGTNESAEVKEDGRTALHVACQKVNDHQVLS